MKLTMIETMTGAAPAALLTNGKFLNLATASAAGLVDGYSIQSVKNILDLKTGFLPAVRRLVERAEALEQSVLGQLASLDAFVEEATASYALLLKPGIILSSGMAYKEPGQEANAKSPEAPTAFLKSGNTVNAHRNPIVLPARDPDLVDYECEFACVVGRPFHNVEPVDALAHIAGFTMVNDVGSRSRVAEWIKSMNGGNVMECVNLYALTVLDKQYPGFCPLGPVVVTADEFGDSDDVTVETRLNGKLVQSAHSSELIFPLAYTLSYFSRWYRFEPGDVITTGSPAGFGFAQKPPRLLKPGDVVEVSGSRIGTLSNSVVLGSK